jgi:diaminopimelate epimerase
MSKKMERLYVMVLYGKEGSNINFVKQIDANTFSLRTYERGVEDETLLAELGDSCSYSYNATG